MNMRARARACKEIHIETLLTFEGVEFDILSHFELERSSLAIRSVTKLVAIFLKKTKYRTAGTSLGCVGTTPLHIEG